MNKSQWYDPIPQDPDLYRAAWCEECGDTQAIERDGAWRCTVCGAEIVTAERLDA